MRSAVTDTAAALEKSEPIGALPWPVGSLGRRRWPRFLPPSPTRGFTLVEVIVSAFVLATIAISILATLTYASQITRLNSYAIAAKNIAQGYLERMQIDDFDNVDPAKYPDIDYTSKPPVWLDQALGISCRIEFKFKGFGTLTDSSGNNLTDNNIHWDPDEWKGDTVFLTGGPGAGQYAVIDFNTPNTLHLADSLDVPPRKGTTYMINNGKTVQITVRYRFRGRTFSQTVRSLIINYRR